MSKSVKAVIAKYVKTAIPQKFVKWKDPYTERGKFFFFMEAFEYANGGAVTSYSKTTDAAKKRLGRYKKFFVDTLPYDADQDGHRVLIKVGPFSSEEDMEKVKDHVGHYDYRDEDLSDAEQGRTWNDNY